MAARSKPAAQFGCAVSFDQRSSWLGWSERQRKRADRIYRHGFLATFYREHGFSAFNRECRRQAFNRKCRRQAVHRQCICESERSFQREPRKFFLRYGEGEHRVILLPRVRGQRVWRGEQCLERAQLQQSWRFEQGQ